MKVILLQDVARIGRRYEVKEVPTGHALNYLIPRKMAEPASPQSLKRVESLKAKQMSDAEGADAQFKEALEKLNESTIEILVEANEKGGLFKAVKAEDITEHLRSKEGVVLASDQIVLDAPVKEVGEHTVGLKGPEGEGSFTLSVKARS